MLYLIKFGVSLTFVVMFFISASMYSNSINQYDYVSSPWPKRIAATIFGLLATSLFCTIYFGFKLLTMRYL